MKSLTILAALGLTIALAGTAFAEPQHQRQHQQYQHQHRDGIGGPLGWGLGVGGAVLGGGLLLGDALVGDHIYNNDPGCIRWMQTRHGTRQVNICD